MADGRAAIGATRDSASRSALFSKQFDVTGDQPRLNRVIPNSIRQPVAPQDSDGNVL